MAGLLPGICPPHLSVPSSYPCSWTTHTHLKLSLDLPPSHKLYLIPLHTVLCEAPGCEFGDTQGLCYQSSPHKIMGAHMGSPVSWRIRAACSTSFSPASITVPGTWSFLSFFFFWLLCSLWSSSCSFHNSGPLTHCALPGIESASWGSREAADPVAPQWTLRKWRLLDFQGFLLFIIAFPSCSSGHGVIHKQRIIAEL